MGTNKNFILQKKYLEFLPALFQVLWGLWILNPFENTFKITSAYNLMGTLAPEWVWGLILFVIGLFQLVVIFKGNLHLRAVSSILCLFIFITMSILIIFGNPASVTIPTYFMFALCEWFAYTEILADIKEKK